MKKAISLIVIFAIILTFFLTGTTYAASLDNLSVNVDKTTVRPGQTVKLTINFGVVLGAYTFDIAYDNNIFDFVSVDGGAENNTGDKVRVTFYDATNGRDNMSIVFKAKEGITTSNPTELTVTGEGLANQDASITYDDIINLPHHESKKHPRMSLEARSAQFAPFAALTGYDETIRETARQTEKRIEIN